jgi:DNA-binding PucR family transcriptional regulator
MTLTPEQKDPLRPIIGVENRTAQEVFDIMCDRIRAALEAAERRAGEAEEDRDSQQRIAIAVIAERDTLRARVERLESHLRVAAIWLDGAIKCKNWVWSPDQREAAEHSLGEIEAALTEKEPTDD